MNYNIFILINDSIWGKVKISKYRKTVIDFLQVQINSANADARSFPKCGFVQS